ncbi:MAG: T9SS C-terminal target domain-containing protein [Chitinophagaceae bacterium]|nr:MAG: T9SS C-terminal target domain-containing protein [Chitinophagaceae bacterium]
MNFKMNSIKKIFVVFLLCACFQPVFALPVINEFMASNSEVISDEDGDFEDWIEIYNPTQFTIELNGFFLSDDVDDPYRWQFPDYTLNPGEFLLVFASGKNRKSGPYFHTNFRIDKDGEPLILSSPDSVWVDWIEPIQLLTNTSYGRKTDGGAEWVYFSVSSPGISNASGVKGPAPEDIIESSLPSGFYPSGTPLTLFFKNQDADIYYTINGERPDINSFKFSDSISLSRLLIPDRHYSNIQTAPRWQEPNSTQFGAIVLRAAAFKNGIRVSNYLQNVYFPEEMWPNKDWSVFSIIMDEDDFFSHERGIYVPGPGFEEDPYRANYYKRGDDWERTVQLSFFNTEQELIFEHLAGARIHGDGTRKAPQKSIRLYARNRYGYETFDYPFFEKKPNIKSFKRLILRTSMGDWNRLGLTDEFVTAAVRPLNLDYMEFLPVIVFINGEFWGIHHLRERIDQYYYMSNHGVNPENIDEIDGLGYANRGTADAYFKMFNFFRNADPQEAGFYDETSKLIDIENVVDYFIAKMYFRNLDWPFRNYTLWKSEYGKWRWVFFDCDACLIRFGDYNMLEYLQEQHFPEHIDADLFLIIRRLLQNEKTYGLFMQRLNRHIEHTFSPERLLPILDKMAENHRHYIEEQVKRWHVPASVYQFEQNIKDLERFIIRRHELMSRQFSKIARESVKVYPNPLSLETGKLTVSATFLKNNSKLQYSLIDMKGMEMLSGEIQNGRELTFPRSINPGSYILKLKNDGFVFNKKLIIQ